MPAPKKDSVAKKSTPKKGVLSDKAPKKTVKKAKPVSKSKTKALTIKAKPAPSKPRKTNKTKKDSFFSTAYWNRLVKKSFSWNQWIATVVNALMCWKSIVLGFILVFALAVGLQYVGVIIFEKLLLLLFGGELGLENVAANLAVGTPPSTSQLVLTSLVFVLWFGYVFYLLSITLISLYLLIRRHVNKTTEWAFVLFFKEANRFFFRSTGILLRLLFSVTGPLILLMSVVTAWDLTVSYAAVNNLELPIAPMAIIYYLILFFIPVVLIYTIFAFIKMLFAFPLLVHSNGSARETFKLAKTLTHKNWWFTFLMWVLFMVVLNALNLVIDMVAAFDTFILMPATQMSEALRLTDLLAFLISMFIFGPIVIAFQYYLMLQCAKNQSVKI
jgi:hypothetical protein